MASITSLQGSDGVTTPNSMTKINQNFANLNSDKIETSYLDTDNTLAANSDTKIPSQKAVKAYVDSGGNPNASETQKGIVEEATDAEVTAGTATGGTGARLFVNPKAVAETGANKIAKIKSTGLLDSAIIPDTGATKKVGVGTISNTTYENYQLWFGGAAASDFGWTSIGSPTYSYNRLVTGSATGAFHTMLINLKTGGNYFFDDTKIKIFEWDALIAADTTTGTSAMGIGTPSAVAGFQDSQVEETIGFITNASGAWYIHTSKDATHFTSTLISTPAPGRHTFRFEYNGATPSVTFYIDGVSVGTLNTAANMPSSNNQVYQMLFANGTTSVIITALSAINISLEK